MMTESSIRYARFCHGLQPGRDDPSENGKKKNNNRKKTVAIPRR